MTEDDILDKEIVRLQEFVEKRQFSFLRRMHHSKPALISIAVMVFLFQVRKLPEKLANSSLDAAIAIQRQSPARSVRLVVIDDQDYADIFHSRSPLDAPALSLLLKAVAQALPKAIVVDIDTADSSFRALTIPPVPIVWNVAGDEAAADQFTIDSPIGGRPLPPRSSPALAAAPRDDRGVVRGYQHTYKLKNGGSVDSPGYAAAKLVTGHAPNEPDGHATDTHFLDFRYQFAPIKARDLLSSAQSGGWDKMNLFRDQVVVIGGTYRVGRDRYATPKGLLDGCEIVAQAVAAELDGTFITSASRWLTGLLMIMGGLATLALYHWLPFRRAFLISLSFIPLLSILSNWILFHRFAAWGAMVPLVVVVIIGELYSNAALYLAFYQKVSKVKTT